MDIGHLNQKASSITSIFVMSCCVVIVFLLYITEKSFDQKKHIDSKKGDITLYFE
jgi:hypothetical protein